MMTRSAFSFSTTRFSTLATPSGSTSASVFTRMARSAPMASAVRSVSCDLTEPIDTATTSVASPRSLMRTASSTAISSNGFIDILTLARSTPVPSDLTRTLTLKSTTRFTGTRIFMRLFFPARAFVSPRTHTKHVISQVRDGPDGTAGNRASQWFLGFSSGSQAPPRVRSNSGTPRRRMNRIRIAPAAKPPICAPQATLSSVSMRRLANCARIQKPSAQ